MQLEPLPHGANHEDGHRSGTENVLEIVGFGLACESCEQCWDSSLTLQLRNHFWSCLQEKFDQRVELNGHPENRLPNTLNVSFPGKMGHEILSRIDGLAASTGSACHAGSRQISPVLTAMGVPDSIGLGAIRFSLGRHSELGEVEWVVNQLVRAVHSLESTNILNPRFVPGN